MEKNEARILGETIFKLVDEYEKKTGDAIDHLQLAWKPVYRKSKKVTFDKHIEISSAKDAMIYFGKEGKC